MKKQCHEYCVVQRLCEHDAPAYHAFLFSLLDSLTTSSIDPIQFILTELERFEPQAADSIATVLHFMTLLNQTMLVFDIRSFFQFSSEPPLTIRFVKEAWVDFLRERVTEATIPQLKELCAYHAVADTHRGSLLRVESGRLSGEGGFVFVVFVMTRL